MEATETLNEESGNRALAKGEERAACRHCRLPMRWCICTFAPKLKNKTPLTLLVHNIEWRKSSNSGHLVRLALSDKKILIQGRPHMRLTEQDFSWNSCHPYVLFPGRGARKIADIPEEHRQKGIHLIVPDGNWRQSSHMMKRVTPLTTMPAVMLDDLAPMHRRMRVNISPERMSTFEAIALALAQLDPEVDLAHLLHFYRLYADRMLMLRGRLKASQTEKSLQF